MFKQIKREQIEIFVCLNEIDNKLNCLIKFTDLQFKTIKQTEIQNQQKQKNFNTTFKVDFKFEEIQRIIFEVISIDNYKEILIGIYETTIGQLIGAQNNMIIGKLDSPFKQGNIIIKAQKYSVSDQIINMDCYVQLLKKSCFCNFQKSYFILKFLKIRNSKELNLVYQSTIFENLQSQTLKIDYFELCGLNQKQMFMIQMYKLNQDKGEEILIGSYESTIETIQQQKVIKILDKKRKIKANLIIKNIQIEINHTFIDYIKRGASINIIGAIDFTTSNGHQSKSDSLHQVANLSNNMYVQCFQRIIETLQNFNCKQKCPFYGFGAKCNIPSINEKQITHHCFPLNGKPSEPGCIDLNEIKDAYFYALKNIEFSGPTFLRPVLEQTIKYSYQIQSQNSNQYLILLVLTDGIIHDSEQTISLLQQAQKLPISIIIIGIGDENFKQIQQIQIDFDEIETNRSFFQFVCLNDFNRNIEELSQKVLQQFFQQYLEYMKLIQLDPYIENIDDYHDHQEQQIQLCNILELNKL